MLLRPHFAAAIVVVPVPKNGSRTLSPTKLNMRIQSFGEFPRIRSRMIFRRSSREAAPYLLKPLFVFVNGDHGFN